MTATHSIIAIAAREIGPLSIYTVGEPAVIIFNYEQEKK
jgi:hypothetical protein